MNTLVEVATASTGGNNPLGVGGNGNDHATAYPETIQSTKQLHIQMLELQDAPANSVDNSRFPRLNLKNILFPMVKNLNF